MATGKILIARHQLIGGKKGSTTVSPGDQITDAVKKEFGLKAADIADLIDKGVIAEVSVHAETTADDADANAALAAEKKRADDAESALAAEKERADNAEAKITELEKQLKEAAKPAE